MALPSIDKIERPECASRRFVWRLLDAWIFEVGISERRSRERRRGKGGGGFDLKLIPYKSLPD